MRTNATTPADRAGLSHLPGPYRGPPRVNPQCFSIPHLNIRPTSSSHASARELPKMFFNPSRTPTHAGIAGRIATDLVSQATPADPVPLNRNMRYLGKAYARGYRMSTKILFF